MSQAFSLIVLILGISLSSAQDSAEVSLICWSPHISPADSEDDIGIEWTLSVSSVANENQVNGEMLISGSDNPYTHEGYFFFENLFTVEPMIVGFILDVPAQNEDENALFDFFELENSIEGAATQGEYINPLSGDQTVFEAVWYRSAGESMGVVELRFSDLGLVFQNWFQILAFTGEYEYEVNGSIIEGEFTASNPLNEEEVLSGPLTLTIESADMLSYPAGEFTGPYEWVYPYTPGDPLERFDLEYLSNVIFDDGYPGTDTPDFQFWLMTINSADRNGNEVPDLVEGATPIAPPTLEAIRVEEGIQITITGAAGVSYVLERKVHLTDEWIQAETIALATDSHVLVLPAEGASAFFRLEQL